MRTRVTVGLGLIAIALIGIAWHSRGGGDDGATTASAPAGEAAASGSGSASPVARAGVAARPALGAPLTAGADDPARPQPVPVDTTDPKLAPPPLDGPHATPAPPQKPFTREETIQHRVDDLALLDDTAKRLQADLETAQKRGDTEDARILQVRITRLTALRETRRNELEALRHGGPLPP